MTLPSRSSWATSANEPAEIQALAASPGGDAGTIPVLHTIFAVGAIQVLSMAFTLMRSKVIAVSLGPMGVGTIGLIDQVATLVAQVCTFSLPIAAVKFLSAAHSEGRESFATLYVAFLRLLLFVSVTGTAIGVLLLWEWPGVLGRELIGNVSLTILALLAIPATNLSALVANTIAAARRVHAAAVYGFFLTASLAILTATGAILDGLRGYYLGNLIALIAIVSGGILFLHRREGLWIHKGHLSVRQELRRYPKVATLAAALYVLSFTSPLAELVARYAVLRSGGIVAVGLFQAAIGIAFAMRTVVRSSFAVFLMPAVNRNIGTLDKVDKSVEFLRALSVITGIMALPLVLFPDLCVFLLYSRQFLGVSSYVYLFVVAVMMQLFGAVHLVLLVGLDQIGAYVAASLLGDLATAVLSWFLVPHLGFNGVGIALLASGITVLASTSLLLHARHRTRIHVAMGFLPFCAVAVVAATGVVATFFPGNTPMVILGKVLVGTILGLGLLMSAPHRGAGLLPQLRRLPRL